MRGAVAQPSMRSVQRLTLDEFVNELATSAASARSRVNADLDDVSVASFTEAEHARLTQSIVDGFLAHEFPWQTAICPLLREILAS